MKNLLDTIQPWLSLRKVAVNEELILGSEKINGVALNIFQSALFAKKLAGKHIYLAGDAAAGVPFFRALNAGLIAATLTAKTIALNTSPDLIKLNQDLSQLMYKEIKRAKKENTKVNAGRALNYVLSNASKVTTGALLKPDEEAAMLHARIDKPNFIRRHPRFLMTLGGGLTVTLVLSLLTLPLFPVGQAILFSVLGGIAITSLSALLFKMTLYIRDKVKGLPLRREIASLPWESNDNNHSLKLLGQLARNNGSDQEAIDVAHYPSPLKCKEPALAKTLRSSNEPPLVRMRA